MTENIKVRWLTDNEQTKVAPKTISTQILNEDGTCFKDTVENAITNVETEIVTHASNGDIHVTAEEKEAWSNIEVPSLDGYATEEYVENLYQKLNSNTVLGFYCIEDVTITTNGNPKVYPANSNVEIKFIEGDTFEIIPTSNNSILSLTAYPGTLGTFYPWLEGIAQFSNILFDMNDVEMYSKWSQGNQGAYHVQKAQYTNCIFWSDNPYISDVSKRTNYTLTHSAQLPLCYSTIPDNTFKAFYLAFGVNSDPNWGNQAYRDSFAKANWATQVFSYYGARTIGIVGHDDPDFNIVLPKDCRGLMFDARHIENAGTFDAINVTNFGAKSGSWREAFGFCPSLTRLYIKNLKVSLNISWSPIDYESISYIISAAANTGKITISVSSHTYNLLSQADFDLAASKNITIALLTGNYVEDRRLSQIANKADKTEVEAISTLVGDTPVSDQISEAVANMSTGADWNQNDETAKDYIKNRPFYKEEYLYTFIDDESIELNNELSYIWMQGSSAVFQEIFYVTFNGSEYEFPIESAVYDGDVYYFGNMSLILDEYENTGELFCIECSYDGIRCKVEIADTYSLRIIGSRSTIYKIDEVYVPDTIARIDDLSTKLDVRNPNGTGSFSLNRKANSDIGSRSFAVGNSSIASGMASYAAGVYTEATGTASHAEGDHTIASGNNSHAEGMSTQATGINSHAEGMYTMASSDSSHAEGAYTIASSKCQHVQGKYNVEDAKNTYAHIVGNGTGTGARSNAHTLDWDGNAWFAGDVYVGSTSGTNKDEGSKKLATEEYVDIRVPAWTDDDEGAVLKIVNGMPTWVK